jgi:hypothetical protein
MGRGRERCARMGFFWLRELREEVSVVQGWDFFCWLQEWGDEKRALGGGGIFMARGTHSTIIEKTALEKIRVVVGSVLVKLIQF